MATQNLLKLILLLMLMMRNNLLLVEVVTVVDVSDEDRVGNSLLQNLKLRFSQKAKLLFGL